MYSLAKYIDFTKIHDDEYIASMDLIKMKKTENYFILKYNKAQLNATNYTTLGLFRSVIIKDGKIVCFSPQKSLPVELVDVSEVNPQKIHYEEYVEGTMVNMFYDGTDWEVATRSSIGAKTNFYNGSDTFRYLFLDALNRYEDFTFDMLDKTKCYSFVLQHPQNRIVKRMTTPIVYLCAVYSFLEDGTTVKEEPLNEIVGLEMFQRPQTLLGGYDVVKDLYANKAKTPYDVCGFVMKFENGTRSKLRNPVYEEVRRLRGNQAKKQYQYYSLRKTGNIAKYLAFYPEDSQEFNKYRVQLHNYTNNLFQTYIECFVKKMYPLSQAPYEYRRHLYKLQELYVNKLFPENKIVTKFVVIQYMNALDPAQQMFCVNYTLRKSKVASTASDSASVTEDNNAS
jgi:hypothetical protein